ILAYDVTPSVVLSPSPGSPASDHCAAMSEVNTANLGEYVLSVDPAVRSSLQGAGHALCLSGSQPLPERRRVERAGRSGGGRLPRWLAQLLFGVTWAASSEHGDGNEHQGDHGADREPDVQGPYAACRLPQQRGKSPQPQNGSARSRPPLPVVRQI